MVEDGVPLPAGEEETVFFTASRLALWPTQASIQWILRGFFLGGEKAEA
jgi:hypothetical protein